MKKLLYICLTAICIVSSSCADFLDKAPDDELTLQMVFKDKIRTEGWLANVYNGIPDPYWGMVNDIGYDSMSDDVAPSPRWVQWSWNVINQQTGNWNTNSPWAADFWAGLPKRIRSAYIFIDNVKPDIAQQVTEADVENMKNESRFLIAYYYWTMINAYGGVPMYDGIVPSDASLEQLSVGQRPFDEMIDWIDTQLVDLSTKLPASYPDVLDYGRATSIMCLAVRARMLMFAASPLVNGNADYENYKNNKGEKIFNTTYDPQKWVRATNACRELIDAAHTAGHELYKVYNEDGTIDPFLSYQNMMFKKYSEGNKEILFARPSSNYSGYEGHATPRGASGNGGLGVTQSLVDAFFMKNGLSPILGYDTEHKPIINEASGYTERGFSAANELRPTKWIEGAKDADKISGLERPVTQAGTYNMYCNREPRFYISVLYNRAWYRSENRPTRFLSGEIDGGSTHDAPQNGYLLRKKVSPDHNTRNNNYPYRPGILYRLGEAYLNYAEALNESDPGNPEIMAYVNLIRERAGIPLYGSEAGQIAYTSDQVEVRELIRRERRVELNSESGIRYNDLRRWMLAEKELNGNFYGMNFSGTKISDDPADKAAYFVRKVTFKRVYTKKNYWYPIYQNEIDKDPSLKQAPFWDE